MQYFSRFPKILYPYQGKLTGTVNDKIEFIECTDILLRFRVLEEVVSNPLAIYTYKWKDGDRPDKVADLYYGDANLAWIVMLSGGLFDWFGDLPKDDESFAQYIIGKYGSFEEAAQKISHYEDGDGDQISLEMFETIVDDGKRIVSCLDAETEANDAKRDVKLISNQFTKQLRTDFERQIKRVVDARRLAAISENN